MQKNIKVSVIYVNYKSLDDIKKSIASIIRYKPKLNYEIIVVDNEGSLELNKYSESKQFRYVKSKGNVGYARGNNLGARYAKGEYLFILNPDTKLEPLVIEKLVKFLETNTDAAIAAPFLTDAKGKSVKQISARRLTPLNQIFTYTFVSKILSVNRVKNKFLDEKKDTIDPYEVEVVPGSAFMIRRSVFEELGGFDEKFFLYFEENDICKRVIEKGYKISKIPNAKVIHDWKPADGNRKLKNIFEDSRFYYFKKHYGIFSALIVEIFSRLSKTAIYILLLFLTGLFLRLYKLDDVFPFSGEVGHNLLEIKNYYENGQIPLAGPPTSHPWLKFGPLFYWIYGPFWILAKFNPLSYAYFGAVISSLIIPLNYLVVKKLLNDKTAVISTALITFSPLFLSYSLSARFFNIVALLIYPFIYFLYKFIYENKKYLFLMFLTFGVMLNFHYAPIILLPAILLLVYLRKIKISLKDISISISAIIIPLIPLVIYDIQNGFKMLGKFAIWIPYRIAGFLGIFPKNETLMGSFSVSIRTLHQFICKSVIENNQLGLLIAVLTFMYALYLLIGLRTKKYKEGLFIILIIFFLGIAAIFIHGGLYITHYYLPIFPLPIIIFSHLLSQIKNKRLLTLIIIILASVNALNAIQSRNNISRQDVISDDRLYVPLVLQKDVAKFIVEDSRGYPFSLQRFGPFDYYEGNYAQNYQYLLWFYGNEPVLVGEQLISDELIEKIEYTIIEGKERVIGRTVYSKGNIFVSKDIIR